MSVPSTTTRRVTGGVSGAPKRFSWSYSRLDKYETCPKRYWHIDVNKDIVEPEGEQLKYGNLVHTILADYIAKGTQMPPYHEPTLKPWADRVLKGPGTILVEQKLAITEEFGPCEFFAKNAWFRGIGDVVKVNGPVALVLDWKTGKIKEDSVQLALMAACVFAHYPQVQAVQSKFIWLKEDAETVAVLKRTEMPGFWNGVLPRVRTLQHAHEKELFPAKPNGLCKRWCPVHVCPHHGV